MKRMKDNKRKLSQAKTELLMPKFIHRGKRMASPLRTNSYTLIPNPKYRRSDRHSCRLGNILDTDSPLLSTLGIFKTLPLEIFQMVLEYLPVKDISMLSMVSKTISNRLINYISTPTGNRRFLLQDFHNPELSGCRKGFSILEHYKSLGLLLKRCTLLLPTKERLRYMHKILSEISCFKLSGCSDPLHCLGLQCYGVLVQNISRIGAFYLQADANYVRFHSEPGIVCTSIQTLTAGWDELECHRVYNFLCELSNLPRRMQTVVSSKPGSARKLELRIRIFCRSVLLNHWIHRSDSAFWLTRILKPWPMVNQARLLYIIFGPVSTLDGHVVWQKMIDGPADEASLKGLADAIKLLYDTEAKEWTADDVISLVDELAVVPREWLLENSARLLILCRNNICFTFMASKAVNGRANELARLVVFLTLVCEKDLYFMEWAVKMMQNVCKVFSTPAERNNFLQSVENAFAHIIMDALQSVISGEHDEEDSSFLNLFHLVNAQANFHKEILYLTMSNNL